MRNVLIGTGVVGEAIFDAFANQVQFDLAVVDSKFVEAGIWNDLPVISTEEYLKSEDLSGDSFVVAIGYTESNSLRRKKFEALRASGAKPLSLIHEKSYISAKSCIEQGVVIFPQVVVENHVTVEVGSILWSNSVIGHESRISPYCFLAASVTVAGAAVVEEQCTLGVGALVGNHVRIGRGSIIGAGAIVTKHVKDESVVINPSSPILGLPPKFFDQLSGFDSLKP
jgi:sugar O-acyltransferase (sialic acid O-acetyltransferase NeuD family)